MMKIILTAIILVSSIVGAYAQTLKFEGREFDITNVKASVVTLRGKTALKVERDLEKLPFDINSMVSTVDEPTFVKLSDFNFENGTIEVNVLSRLQDPLPFEAARGFIGLAFRINEDNSTFESIYLRPTNGRDEDQFRRNHTVQYCAYPDYKFDRLRKESAGQYETYADIGLDEWITVRIEVKDRKAVLYLNNQKHPSFIVKEMLGKTSLGSIGMWVDIGTEGYFKDLKIIKE